MLLLLYFCVATEFSMNKDVNMPEELAIEKLTLISNEWLSTDKTFSLASGRVINEPSLAQPDRLTGTKYELYTADCYWSDGNRQLKHFVELKLNLTKNLSYSFTVM